MRNRFSNRETLNLQIGGGGFDPVGGAGSVNQSTSINSTKAADVPSISALDAIKNALNIKFEPGTAATIAAREFAQAGA
jgi:hypothetical protein